MPDYAIPALVGVLAGFATAGYFSGFIAYPFELTPLSGVTPIAYTPKDDQPYRVVYTVQQKGDMGVYQYWYVWTHDGAEQRDDPEPVFVYYKGSSKQPYAIAHRLHYQWRVKYTGIITEDSRPVFSFLTGNHVPEMGYPPSVGDYEIVKLAPQQGPLPEMIDPWQIVDVQQATQRGILYGAGAGVAAFVLVALAVNLPRTIKKRR